MPTRTKTGNTPKEQFGVKTMVKDISKKLGITKPKRPNTNAPVRPVKPVPKASKKLMPKQLTGDAAIKAYQKEISPRGIKKKSEGNKMAIDKKYPGLYKSATPKPKKK